MPQVDTPNEIATDRENLSSGEEQILDATFQRGLEDTYVEASEVIRRKVQEYRDEIVQAAEIARAQFDQPFGGLNPKEGRFAVSRTHSGFFGYDSWETGTSYTAGQLNDWIDDGSPDNLTGSSGIAEPLKVGDQAVHIILGYGTYSDSPKTSAIKYRLNDQPRTAIKTKWEFTRTDTQIKWLDRPTVLPENALFSAQLYADSGGEDPVYPIGLSFLEYRASQTADPANMTDDTSDTSDNIVAQG